ncbi:MAG: fused ferrous iron transport protein A/B, partial [Bacteroidota bacterium]|nr:fused ferrous iron transport protein A/B [Bacteroidota bacterium]
MKLADLETGEKAVIVKVSGHGGFRKRIIEMGFVRGKVVECLQNAPLLDPVKYRIMSYEVSLRRSEAANIEVIGTGELFQSSETDTFNGTIEEDILRRVALNQRKRINVALVGNPNCGKTSLFNKASGGHEHEGNYSGVTVDAKEGQFEFDGYTINLVDLPGTYSLSAYSPEELYVRHHLVNEQPDVVINVVDGSNLERNLFLTTQLIDMNVRMVVALNMYDELEKSGDALDYRQLGKLLGAPIIPTVGRKGWGLDKLFHVVTKVYEGTDFFSKDGRLKKNTLDELHEYYHASEVEHGFIEELGEQNLRGGEMTRHIHINHGQVLEKAIAGIRQSILVNEQIRAVYSTRFLAIKMLEHDKEAEAVLSKMPNAVDIFSIRDKADDMVRKELKEDPEAAIANAKYGFISGALAETFTKRKIEKKTKTTTIDSVVLNKYLGYPIFLLFMFIMFECTFVLGEYPKHWIESGVNFLSELVRAGMTEGPLKDLLLEGIISGVGGVIVFLP